VNSAISAWYYLHIAGVPIVKMTTPRSEALTPQPNGSPRVVACIAGLALLIVPIFSRNIYSFARSSMRYGELEMPVEDTADKIDLDTEKDPRPEED
jgi:NADH:ubiquinone oxidoreductase subunit 2 (subunit N)